jgi:hypothetical protein
MHQQAADQAASMVAAVALTGGGAGSDAAAPDAAFSLHANTNTSSNAVSMNPSTPSFDSTTTSTSSTSSSHSSSEQHNQQRSTAASDWLNGAKTATAGGIAGAFAKSCTAPLARLTILYQVRCCCSQLLVMPGLTRVFACRRQCMHA